MSNQTRVRTGIQYEDREDDLAALEQLPAVLRQELTNFAYSMSAQMVLDDWKMNQFWTTPEKYLRETMRPILAQTMAANSYTGIEPYGTYKIVPNVHGKPCHTGRIFGVRGRRAGRHARIFGPIQTRRGTEIDYR